MAVNNFIVIENGEETGREISEYEAMWFRIEFFV